MRLPMIHYFQSVRIILNLVSNSIFNRPLLSLSPENQFLYFTFLSLLKMVIEREMRRALP